MQYLKKHIAELSKKLNLSEKVIEEVYKAYWRAIKNIMESNNLKSNLTEKEFNKLNLNISVNKLGKLYSTYPKYKAIKQSFEKYDNKVNKTNVDKGIGNSREI